MILINRPKLLRRLYSGVRLTTVSVIVRRHSWIIIINWIRPLSFDNELRSGQWIGRLWLILISGLRLVLTSKLRLLLTGKLRLVLISVAVNEHTILIVGLSGVQIEILNRVSVYERRIDF